MLFGNGTEDEIFQQMVDLLGPVPADMADQAEKTFSGIKFDGRAEQASLESRLKEMLLVKKPDLADDDVRQVLDFISCMLQWSPNQRKSAKELVSQPWLQQ